MHHLVGNKPLGQSISAGQYAKLVYKCIEKIWIKGKKPIVCGGAGLYYRALNKGIFDESKTDLKIRKKLEKMYDDGRALEMHSKLKNVIFWISKIMCNFRCISSDQHQQKKDRIKCYDSLDDAFIDQLHC